MKTKTLQIILAILCLPLFCLGTAQVPDLLIYKGDTLSLYANPLEDYYTENNPRPPSFGINSCLSTACWRGYQAIWTLENEKLYLLAIRDCCFWATYELSPQILDELEGEIPEEILGKLRKSKGESELDLYEFNEYLIKTIGKKSYKKYGKLLKAKAKGARSEADLTKLFPNKVEDGKVAAFWFSGMLRVPKGELLEYVHMGYMSTYQFELAIEIDQGILIEENEYENKPLDMKDGFGMLSSIRFSLALPIELLDEEKHTYAFSDTLNYTDSEGKMIFEGQAKSNGKRLSPKEREERAIANVDSLQKAYPDYSFEKSISEKMRWGAGAWVDGYDKRKDTYLRLFTLCNINSQLFISFSYQANYEDFHEIGEYIIETCQLMEFSY